MACRHNDLLIANLIASGRVSVNSVSGLVFASKSNSPGKPLGAPTSKGYLRTSINVNGRAITLMVHRIVWIAVNGVPHDSAMHINHKNGDKQDNSIANLELVSHVENMAHSRLLGLHKGTGRKDGLRDSAGRFVGKACAGRLLDGREWNEFPEVGR